MKKQLRILFVEDNEDDMLLASDALRREGYELAQARVQNAPDMARSLEEKDWDIILCDYSMPVFNAPGAIKVLKDSGQKIPLIIVSGTVGEDVAVEALKLGASDYLLKQNLARLVPAVERSLRQAEIERERMGQEQKIREQARLLDQAQDAIFVVGMDRRISYWNKGAQRIYGWTSEEVLGRSPESLFLPDQDTVEAAWQTLLTRGEWSGELEDNTKDGSRIAVESRWTLLRNGHGTPRSVLAINTDITERKNLQEQVMRTQRLESIGTLTSGIAHDFNNLLTIINGHAEIGLLKLPPDDPHREPLQNIHDAGRRAASLTSQLLAFSRKSLMEPVELDLNSVLLELEKMLRRLIGEDVHLTVNTDPSLPPVRSDPTHIEQVIMNLSVNARDAMPGGGSLTIGTRHTTVTAGSPPPPVGLAPGHYVLLIVSDTGTGIPDDIKDRIFEPFFTTKEAGRGTGLGLSTVYGIVSQNGGHIQVESTPGTGTTFQICLPASTATPATPATPATTASTTSQVLPRGTEHILLIEDDPAVRRLTTLVLESLGYAVTGTASADHVLELAVRKDQRVDLLLTDVIMPGMDGGSLAGAVRRLRPGLPVFFTSGYTSHAILEQPILKSGAPFLQKPFSTQQLARKVREALDGTG